MQIEKLPSGSYRIRLMENGKLHSMTVPFKPTQKQAYELIREKIDNPTSKYDSMTFYDAVDAYISTKDKLFSPSTIKGYKTIQRSLPDSFTSMQLKDIDQIVVQKLINNYHKDHSAKSCRNAHGLICAVFGAFMPQVEFHTTLPRKEPVTKYMPSKEEVMRLLEESKGTEFFVPLSLACLSCRRSEICAATIDDIKVIEGNEYLYINKALLIGEGNEYIVYPFTKTDASTRYIPLPPELAKVIHEQGYIYNGFIGDISKYIRKACKKLDMPEFSIHALRHFYASYMMHLGYSVASIQAGGGWVKGSNVLQKIYIEEMESEKTRMEMANQIGALFS